MKHCKGIDFDLTPTGAIFRGERWPAEIEVDRGLLDYLPGPHVSFGRFGVLRFSALNGYAVYRRFEDKPSGWNYRLVEQQLKAHAPAVASEPQLQKAEGWYRKNSGGLPVQAFQWLPDAVPPVILPEWFVRADFEHNNKGHLTIHQSGGKMSAEPSDWILRGGLEIAVMKPEAFAQTFKQLEAA